jgi:hypothetical protein
LTIPVRAGETTDGGLLPVDQAVRWVLDGEPWAALAEPSLLQRHQFDVRLDDENHLQRPEWVHLAPGRYSIQAAVTSTGHANDRWIGPEHGCAFVSLGELLVMPDVSPQPVQVQLEPLLH